MEDEPYYCNRRLYEDRCKLPACLCFPGMSNKKSSSCKSVSFDADYPDSPTFPRWRANSSNSMSSIGYSDSDIALSDAIKTNKTTVQMAKKRTRLDHMSFQNTVHLAALSGDEKEVKRLLSKGANVNKFDRHGKTPLHNAIHSRITSVVQVVLLAGADVNLPDHHGDTPIHIAVGVGSNDVVKLLLQCPGCQVNLIGQNGLTPLHVAAQLNYLDIAMMLVAHGSSITDKAGYFLSPFALAISKGSYETAKYFASMLGSNITAQMTDVDGENSNALHLAVSSGNLQVVKLCFRHGASAREKRKEDEATPLHIACIRGNLDIVKALVEHDPGIIKAELVDNQGMTPLHRAAVFNHPEVVKYLIEKNFPIDPRDHNCHTPLLLASASGCTASVQVLLEKGADVVLKDSNLNSSLHAAIGNVLTLEALLKDPNSAGQISEKDVNGLTPLHYAVKQGDFKCTKLLLSCNPSAIEIVTDEDDETAIHLAAENGFADIVQLMIEDRNERVLNAKNKQKRTALHLACIEGNETVVEILAPEADIDGDLHHQTPLHCAAKKGSLKCVQFILQAHPRRLNDVDKNKNTALNIAGIAGHAHIVEFLLRIDGLAITCNMNDMNVLDLAIENKCESVALVIAENERLCSIFVLVFANPTPQISNVPSLRWQETLHPTPMGDNSQLGILVQTLPNVAEVFLDRCIEKEGNSSDINYKITYDLRLIQGMSLPGPSHKGYSLKFLKTMAAYKREGCLGHPVCYALMSLKWRKFGWVTFIANLFLYTLFLLSMTILVFKMKQICGAADGGSHNATEQSQSWWECTYNRKFKTLVITQYFVIALILLLIAKEFAELFKRRKKYFQDITNALEWIIYGTALFYILPVCACKQSIQIEAAALCLFCAWINLALHMRRSSTYGRYVLMVLTMLQTVIEVAMLFSLFVIAFGMAFFILLDTKTKVFETVQKSIAKTFVMTLGELTFDQTYLQKDIDHKVMNYFIFVTFCFLMPIILMNMLIGLAVGDIDNIQQNAVIQRYIMQVEHLIELEESLPTWLLRKLRIKQHVEYPNQPKTLWTKLWNMFCSLGTAKDNADDYHHRIPMMLTQLKGKITDNEDRIKELGQVIMQQTQLLRDINRRLAGNAESTGTRIMNWFSSGLGDWRSFRLY